MTSDDEPLGLCDRCGKIAYDEWLNAEGLMLTTCRHHGREWQATLRAQGFWLMAARSVPA